MLNESVSLQIIMNHTPYKEYNIVDAARDWCVFIDEKVLLTLSLVLLYYLFILLLQIYDIENKIFKKVVMTLDFCAFGMVIFVLYIGYAQYESFWLKGMLILSALLIFLLVSWNIYRFIKDKGYVDVKNQIVELKEKIEKVIK